MLNFITTRRHSIIICLNNTTARLQHLNNVLYRKNNQYQKFRDCHGCCYMNNFLATTRGYSYRTNKYAFRMFWVLLYSERKMHVQQAKWIKRVRMVSVEYSKLMASSFLHTVFKLPQLWSVPCYLAQVRAFGSHQFANIWSHFKRTFIFPVGLVFVFEIWIFSTNM